MMNAMPLKTETAMNVPAARSQISILVCSGSLPLVPSRQNLTLRRHREFPQPVRLTAAEEPPSQRPRYRGWAA